MDNKTIELHTIATFQGKEYELENLLNGLLNKLEEKDKEIERLNKELNYYKKEEELYRYYQQEVPRLENIINELEKWAKEELEQPNWASCGARCMLDKLKELKEGVNNE